MGLLQEMASIAISTNFHKSVLRLSGRRSILRFCCSAGSSDAPYSKNDIVVVGEVISQRCLETGVSEVYLSVSEEDRAKEKMVKFIKVIEESGLSLTEPDQYIPPNPHQSDSKRLKMEKNMQSWTVVEE